VAAAAAVGLAAIAYLHFSERPPEPAVMRVSLPLPPGGAGFLSVSPDGRRVLAGLGNLAVRDMDSGEWTRIESARGARTPFWSPDGRSIGFFADGKLKTVSATGGPARELCGETGTGAGGAWRSDGVILFSSDDGPLRRVSASGGACTPVMKADLRRISYFPVFLPDGVHYLYVGQIRGDLTSRGVYVGSLEDPAAIPLSGKKVLDDYSSVLFAPSAESGGSSHLLFLRGSNIMAQRFDARTLGTQGDPFLVAPNGGISMSQPQVAAGVGGGTLVYGSNLKPAGYEPVWMDRAGRRLSSIAPANDLRGVALSSDGLFATLIRTDEGLRVFDLARHSETRLSTDSNPSPGVWSRDGKYVVFSSTIDGVSGIYRKPANGSGKEELLLAAPDNPLLPADLSDTGTLIFVEQNPKTNADIWYWLRPGDASSKPEKFLATAATESLPQLSPDGRWLAYFSNEGGVGQVLVRQFPSGPGFVRVGPGSYPRWKKDGSELYFLTGTTDLTLMAVPMKADGHGGISAGAPVRLFQFESLISTHESNRWLYAPSPDGQRFLVAVRAESAPPTIQVITNWLQAARGAVKE
jgi:serine/threonine-protein kinase